jgi:MSHA biogenesis protein MshQ
LAEKYTIPLGSGTGSGNTMLGAAQFVVQPATLQLSAIQNAGGTANPGASTASGTVFTGAGQPFKATVTALNSAGAVTPNFGQETSPAAVSLTPALVLPASGDNPLVAGSFGTYTSGVASGTAFSWPEVGVVTLTPVVTSYLGSGKVTGTTTGDVGRFIPNNFLVTPNAPMFATGCSAGSFTYIGQPFTYSVAPVLTVTAQALGATTTQNYTGSLFRLTNTSLTARTYTPTPASPALTLTGLPATTADPAIVSSGAGVGTLTFSAGTGISFTRGNAIAPLTANIALSINVIDLDGASATTNPVTFGATSGILFNTSAVQYYGRLALRDALGSELWICRCH